MERRSCILVELIDGSIHAFSYPDEQSARTHLEESRAEWNAGRSLVFNLARSSTNRFSPSNVEYPGDEVAHLELTTREDAEGRAIDLRTALVFG
jgi:hypothetical protein